jgi:hypothetical protein
VGDVDELVSKAETLLQDVLVRARRRLEAGAEMALVQARVDQAMQHLEEIEIYAVLASAGDRDAELAIRQLICRPQLGTGLPARSRGMI